MKRALCWAFMLSMFLSPVMLWAQEEKPASALDAEKYLRELQLTGATAREAVARVAAETGLSRKELYRAWLKLNKITGTREYSCRGAGGVN